MRRGVQINPPAEWIVSARAVMDLRSLLLLIVFGFGATISLAADPQRMVAHLIGEVSSSSILAARGETLN
jgi:hypothetical protein